MAFRMGRLGAIVGITSVVLTSVGAFSDELFKVLPGKRIPAPEELRASTQVTEVLVKIPEAHYGALYKLSVLGHVVGTASVSQDSLTGFADRVLELRLLSRVGASPLYSTFRVAMQGTEANPTVKMTSTVRDRSTEIAQAQATWVMQTGGLVLQEGTGRSDLSWDVAPHAKATWGENVDVVFFSSKNSKVSRYFNPFSGKTFSEDDLSIQRDDDGFIKTATIPWRGAVKLEFTRITINDVAHLVEALRKGIMDFAWVSDSTVQIEDLKKLRILAEKYLAGSLAAEKDVARHMPEVPYLLQRKIFNFETLCQRLVNALNNLEGREKQATDAMIAVVRSTLKEDKRELPDSLVNAIESSVLQDDAKRSQWTKLVTHLLDETKDEISETLSIERLQKTLLVLRLSVDKLGRRSVVKGLLKPKDLAMTTEVDAIKDSAAMLESSWKTLPAFPEGDVASISEAGSNRAAAFELVNGQAFARASFLDFSTVCERFNGKVGVDLGDAGQDIFRSTIARGTWDTAMRVRLISEFARRASSSPVCKHLVVRVPKELEYPARDALESFRREILQTESAFQFSNGGTRKMRLVPGTYEFVASSLVNGSVLGKQEIVVKPGKSSHQTLRLR